MLNDAVHKNDYSNDISKREVTKMLDQMLEERKGVVGKGGLVERMRGGRVTRTVTLCWERRRPIGFDGSLSEWNNGRKKQVEKKERDTLGLPPLEEPVFESGNVREFAAGKAPSFSFREAKMGDGELNELEFSSR